MKVKQTKSQLQGCNTLPLSAVDNRNGCLHLGLCSSVVYPNSQFDPTLNVPQGPRNSWQLFVGCGCWWNLHSPRAWNESTAAGRGRLDAADADCTARSLGR